MQVMDSLALFSAINVTTMLQLAKVYSNVGQSFLNIETLSVQQQDGRYECGVFAIAYATDVCFRNNPEEIYYDQRKMRHHLKTCLQASAFRVFPRTTCD